ncbi:DUF2513 domain-containing protein [Brevundimonas sp. GCM10030266]|uniref:DUF2513 domain-containing protein n=1 Tax=Brevundimonas sp. GCM10030266 TaxID=3273386 RepID=UPI003619D929
MKLNWDLCRDIMLACEDADTGTDEYINLELPGRDPRVVSYHVRALKQAGYLVVDTLPDDEDLDFTWHVPQSVTYGGHRFIAATRDNAVWKRALKTVGDKLVSATLETVIAVAVSEGKRAIGLPPIADGRLQVTCVNRLYIRRIAYDLGFGPAEV